MIELADLEARFFELVESIEGGHRPEIVITRNGKPAARLAPLASSEPNSSSDRDCDG